MSEQVSLSPSNTFWICLMSFLHVQKRFAKTMETAKFDMGLKQDRNLDWGDSEFYEYKEARCQFQALSSWASDVVYRCTSTEKRCDCTLTQGVSPTIPLAALSLVRGHHFELNSLQFTSPGCKERFLAGETKIIGAMKLDPFSCRWREIWLVET